jgi:UDP-N-acetylglucosamine:LPS N-acetylglucosamine transferase
VRAALGLVRATFQGIGLVRTHRPAVVVVLGGHASFACGVGAAWTRRPLVLLEQNVRAGAVNRLLRRFATASAVSFAGTDLPRATVTGNPLRPEIAKAAAAPDREKARAAIGLPAGRTVIGVASGSLGSQRINDAVRGLVERWTDRGDLAVHHVVGRRDWPRFAGLDSGEEDPDRLLYRAVEYEHHMELLLQAADVAVTRAGGSVAELQALGVPAVLVPLPIATRDHQTANARAVAAGGGAVVVPDDELDVDRLERELAAIVDDPARRETMAAAMRSSARTDAADRVADLVESVARPAGAG